MTSNPGPTLMSSSGSSSRPPVRTLPGLGCLKLWGWVGLALLLAVLYSLGILRNPSGPSGTPAPSEYGEAAVVLRVVDGDTMHATVNGREETIRYVGIDTPERGQPGYRAATAANRALVEGKTVYLQRDQTDRDSFGRWLRYIYLADGTFVNAEMIAQGWAQPVNYGRDIAHADEFFALAVQAAQAKRGFWSGTSTYDGAMSYGLTRRGVEMRKGPGTDYPVSGRLEAGVPLSLFGRSPNNRWLQVRPPSRDGGWISVEAVDANVPIVTIPLGEVDGQKLTGGTPVPTPTRTVRATRAPSATHTPQPVTTPAPGSARCPDGCITPPAPVCEIKGNVNSSGEKIYHMPGGALYGRTVINPAEGDRWFCTPTEAEAAGFRAALR